jgi:TonB family protein
MNRLLLSCVIASFVLATPALAQTGRGADPGPVYQPGNGVKQPEVTNRVTPQYTSAAMREKIQGDVWLSGVVETDGTLSNVVVTKSLDAAYGLDQSALDAARQWRFKPGEKDGQPVRTAVQIVLTFKINPRPDSPELDPAFSLGAHRLEESGLVAPKVTKVVNPKYPAEALRQKIQGDVPVQVVVGSDGKPVRARVLPSPDNGHAFDGEALAAVKQYKFEPGTLNGQPVQVLLMLMIQFRLN